MSCPCPSEEPHLGTEVTADGSGQDLNVFCESCALRVHANKAGTAELNCPRQDAV